jgi:hypothetical protein
MKGHLQTTLARFKDRAIHGSVPDESGLRSSFIIACGQGC